MANPNGRPPKERCFANMLRIAINEAVAGGGGTKLRAVADALVAKGMDGDVSAIKEIADRLDGKVPQAIVGDDSEPPIAITRIERLVVDSPNTNAPGLPATSGAGKV